MAFTDRVLYPSQNLAIKKSFSNPKVYTILRMAQCITDVGGLFLK